MKLSILKRSLYARFIISFSFIILLPIVIIGFISFYRSVSQIEGQVKELLQQIVKSTNAQLDKVIRDYTLLTNNILTSKEVFDFLDLAPDDHYGKLQFSNWMNITAAKDFILDKRYVDGIIIISDNGQYYFDSKSEGLANYVKLNRYELLKEKLADDGSVTVFTLGLKKNGNGNTSQGSFLITMGRRIVSINSFKTKGSFFLNMRSEELSEIWKNVDLKGGFILIADDEGIIIHHPDQSKLGMQLDDVIDASVINGGKGRFKNNWNDKEYYFMSDVSEYTGWRIIAAVPLEQLMKPIGNIKNVITYTSIFAFPLSLTLGYFFFRSIIRSIKKLRLKMIDIGKGNWNKYEGKIPRDELGDLIYGYNTMVDKISNLIEQVYKSELVRKKAELQALQTQINPHFLYNTLGIINAYSEMNNMESIQEMIDALGGMFRYAVQNPLELVMIKDELEHVRQFLLIQKHRSKSMPQIDLDIDVYLEYRILRLTLQPLVENAFKHGFIDRNDKQYILKIQIYEESGMLIVKVEDNGVGPSCDTPEMRFYSNDEDLKEGIGLYNVNRRIQIVFGEQYGLRVSGIKGAGMTVKMCIPLQN